MSTVNKIENILVSVDNARVSELETTKASMAKFIDKNLKALKNVSKEMKKAEKDHANAMKKYEKDASVENAYNVEEAKKVLGVCVNTYNVIVNTINDAMVSIQGAYAAHLEAVRVVNPAEAAKRATDFNKYNEKIANTIKKVQ